jgi:hypothetical protein
MLIRLGPLWRQLTVVWLTAVVLVAVLLALQFGGAPTKFFWLIPYPTWRTAPWMVLGLFRMAPLLGSAVTILTVAVLLTVGLCARRAVGRARRPVMPSTAR